MFWRNRLKTVVPGLLSQDDKVRGKAFTKLSEIAERGLSEAEAAYAIRAAALKFIPSEFEWQDANAQLIHAVAQSFHSEIIPEIRRIFAKYPASAQAASLHLLGNVELPEATEALVDLLAQLAEDVPINLENLAEEPRHAEILFPRILNHVQRIRLRWPISKVILAHLSKGWKPTRALTLEIANKMIQIHNDIKQILFQRQQSTGTNWIWEDEYQEYRSLDALVLDVLGRLDNPALMAEFIEVLQSHDPRLKMFAVLGLIRNGVDPERYQIVSVAESAESRNWFYRHLAELGRLELFPESFATQEAFAEGDMVNWLIFPTELARAPDEIELMATIPMTVPQGLSDYFVFRFRTFEPHWAAKKGWLAGVSGPFLWGERPSVKAGGDTFSSFTPWNECPPEEHLRRTLELLQKAANK